MPHSYYLSHPQVQISADIPVPQWSLSEAGLKRARFASSLPWVEDIHHIVSSDEQKALQTALCFAQPLNLDVIIGEKMGENDRSTTGFMPPDQFEHAADCFMNKPNESHRGWERAIDAQVRIVSAVEDAMSQFSKAEHILFVGHGGVGTLLKCFVAGREIARKEDQPANGGGNLFAFDLEARALLCDWTPMEEFSGILS